METVHRMRDIQRLQDTYHWWFRDKSALRQIEYWVEITTPYFDRHKAPERIVRTVNRPNRQTAQTGAFAWLDNQGRAVH